MALTGFEWAKKKIMKSITYNIQKRKMHSEYVSPNEHARMCVNP